MALKHRLIVLICAALILAPAVAAQPFDLQAALAAAQPGDTIVVPPGTYPGPLVVDVSGLTLEGQGWPVIDGQGLGDVITITAPDVTVRGLVIRHSGDSLDRENAGITGTAPRLTIEDNRLEDVLFGIYLKEAPGSVVRRNQVGGKDLDIGRRGDGIRLWYSQDSLVEANHVRDSRDVVMWFSPNMVIRGNTVENGRYGLHFMFSDNQLLEHNVLRRNSVGAFLMYGYGLTMRNNLMIDNNGPSGYGVGLKDVDYVVAEGNRFINNRIGVYVDNSPREADSTVAFRDNLLAYNEIGIELLPLVQRNIYTGNVFQENSEQVAIAGGGELRGNHWSWEGLGNFWSDYAGFDADGDRIGDITYQSKSLYENLLDKYPELRLFQLSPATDAIDLAARAFPIFQPRAKMVDEHPLMAPPALPAAPGLPEPPLAANLAVAIALTGLALLIVALGLRTGLRPVSPARLRAHQSGRSEGGP
jgi:nitrous oxidase accessory protein